MFGSPDPTFVPRSTPSIEGIIEPLGKGAGDFRASAVLLPKNAWSAEAWTLTEDNAAFESGLKLYAWSSGCL